MKKNIGKSKGKKTNKSVKNIVPSSTNTRNEKIRRKMPSNTFNVKINENPKTNKKQNQRQNTNNQKGVKTINKSLVISAIILAMLSMLILYREQMLDKKVNEVAKINDEIAKIEKENSQIELSFQNKLSLNNIEKIAAEKLHMQKQSKNNTVYVRIDVEDFIEPIVITEIENNKEGFFEKIYNNILDLMNKRKKERSVNETK